MPKKHKKKYKARVVLFALLILIFAAGLLLLANLSRGSSDMVSVVTEKTTYNPTDDLKLKVRNMMEKEICFSSCYPYFLQDNSGGWRDHQYGNCTDENVAVDCVEAKSIKAFAISLSNSFLTTDISHRIAVPACIGCILGQKFAVDKVFYSNEFEINK